MKNLIRSVVTILMMFIVLFVSYDTYSQQIEIGKDVSAYTLVYSAAVELPDVRTEIFRFYDHNNPIYYKNIFRCEPDTLDNYDFYLNKELVQSGPSSSYLSVPLKEKDFLQVVTDIGTSLPHTYWDLENMINLIKNDTIIEIEKGRYSYRAVGIENNYIKVVRYEYLNPLDTGYMHCNSLMNDANPALKKLNPYFAIIEIKRNRVLPTY